jgi:hypothetical protein
LLRFILGYSAVGGETCMPYCDEKTLSKAPSLLQGPLRQVELRGQYVLHS